MDEDTALTPRTTSDHVLLQGPTRLRPLRGHRGGRGRPPESPTHVEVTGTEGTLTIRRGVMRGVQSGRLHLQINGEPENIDEGPAASMPDAAANVAAYHAMLRDDILERYAKRAGRQPRYSAEPPCGCCASLVISRGATGEL